MKLSIEGDSLIYLYLTDLSLQTTVSTITSVNGSLIYDDEGNWLGYRVSKIEDYDGAPLEIPPFNNSEKWTSIETDDFIDILFTTEKKAAKYSKQECNIDIYNGKVIGIEILKYSWNRLGQKKWVLPYMK